jgi:hypothetical protein
MANDLGGWLGDAVPVIFPIMGNQFPALPKKIPG